MSNIMGNTVSFDMLNAVFYNTVNDTYDLVFLSNGSSAYINNVKVDEKAKTDEYYFDKEVVEGIIKEYEDQIVYENTEEEI